MSQITMGHIWAGYDFGSDSYFSIILFASVTVLISSSKYEAGFPN